MTNGPLLLAQIVSCLGIALVGFRWLVPFAERKIDALMEKRSRMSRPAFRFWLISWSLWPAVVCFAILILAWQCLTSFVPWNPPK